MSSRAHRLPLLLLFIFTDAASTSLSTPTIHGSGSLKETGPDQARRQDSDNSSCAHSRRRVYRDYFSPLEVAFANRFGHSDSANKKMNRYFYERSMGMYTAPGDLRSGFVFSHLDEGTKTLNVIGVMERQKATTFTFIPSLHHSTAPVSI